jgi:23S rRNA (cytidine1920-2'-O)/16S rRNA (cytidine1409-2'-O)-methyltransferase
MAKQRADQLLVARGLVETRARAQALILAGKIYSGDRRVAKAGDALADDAPLQVKGQDHPWVSRGGLKLAHGLRHFGFSPAGRVCLDVGASTGGFTDVLIARGAAKVVAVDVGHGQLDPRLAADSRVHSLEGVDARALTPEMIGDRPNAIVVDVSFISQRLALPQALKLAARRAWLVSLIKPQFELDRADLVKGRVTSEAALVRACDAVRGAIEAQGWTVLGLIASPILVGAGAREFLIAARHA